MKILKIGTLISGSGSNMQAIIDACSSGKISGKVIFTGTDNHTAYGLERARKHNIDTFTVDYPSILRQYRKAPAKMVPPQDFDINDILKKQNLFPADTPEQKLKLFFTSRAIAEEELLNNIRCFDVDLLVLAGFMRNLSPYFIDRFHADRSMPAIMNIHPALLPAFPGTDGYGDTFGYGCKIGGCTVHFIDYGSDTGPIIAQHSFQIQSKDTLDDVREKGLKLEWELYPECIQLYAENRLKIIETKRERKDGRTVNVKKVSIIE